MSQFEYTAIALSLVLGLSLTRLLEGLRDVFDPTRRYWIHAGWVLGKAVNVLVLFWSGWAFRDAFQATSFLQFVFMLLAPGILFLQIHTLLTPHPDHVADWRSHFLAVRPWFFAANATLPALNAVGFYVFVDRPAGPEVVFLFLTFALSIVGLVSARERVHVGILVLYLIVLGAGVGGLVFRTP